MYAKYLEEHNYIKENRVVKTKGDAKHIHIITVNVTSLHEVNRKWLAEQSADIILVQEHRQLHEINIFIRSSIRGSRPRVSTGPRCIYN